MKWRALATDFDGTLAVDGKITAGNITAIEQLRADGIAVILVSGRSIKELKKLGYDLRLFTVIVAEDGCVLFDPQTETSEILAPLLDDVFLKSLQASAMKPLKVGECAVSTERRNEELARWLCQRNPRYCLLLDKGTFSILPCGTNKSTGLNAALMKLDISSADVLGVGDAENDLELLIACGGRAATSDALPLVKSAAQRVTQSDASGAIAELAMLILHGAEIR